MRLSIVFTKKIKKNFYEINFYIFLIKFSLTHNNFWVYYKYNRRVRTRVNARAIEMIRWLWRKKLAKGRKSG